MYRGVWQSTSQKVPFGLCEGQSVHLSNLQLEAHMACMLLLGKAMQAITLIARRKEPIALSFNKGLRTLAVSGKVSEDSCLLILAQSFVHCVPMTSDRALCPRPCAGCEFNPRRNPLGLSD